VTGGGGLRRASLKLTGEQTGKEGMTGHCSMHFRGLTLDNQRLSPSLTSCRHSTSNLSKSIFALPSYGREDHDHVTMEKGFGFGKFRKPARLHFSGVIYKLRYPRSESLERYGR
jgi:hypothetical protein